MRRGIDRRPQTVQRRFLVLALMAILPLIVLISYLGLREYRLQTANVLSARETAVKERQLELEGLAAVKRSEVSMLASALQSELEAERPAAPQDALSDGAIENRGFQLLPSHASADERNGVILGLREAIMLRASGFAEIAAIRRLFPIQAATHAASARLGWTYFAADTKDLFAIHPWTIPEVILGYQPALEADAFRRLFESEAFRLYSDPVRRQREPFWTPVHLDFLGDTRVLTLAVPVEAKGARFGMFAAQIPISELARILLNFDTPSTALSLVDQHGEILATSSLSLLSDRTDFLSKDRAKQLQPGFTGTINEQNVAVSGVQGTPWRLVAMTPATVVRASAINATAPYGLALIAIFLTFAVVLLLLQHQLIRPVTSIVNFVAAESRGRSLPAPNVPPAWQVLADKVASAARNREAHLHQLRAMIDGIPLRAVYIDHKYIYRDANKEFLDFVGMELGELAGKSVTEVLGENVQQHYERLAPSILKGEVARFEGWIEYYGRGNRYLQVSILPFKALDEDEAGFLTFTKDLTDLKLAEIESARHSEAHAASEALHRSVVMSALDAIIVMDDEGIALEFNPAAQTMFGYSAAEAVGKPVSQLIVPPALREAHSHGLERYLRTGTKHVIGRRVEIEGMRRDGAQIPVELTITEVKIGARQMFISHLRDLTDQRAKKRELDEQTEKLHQAEKLTAMGSLLAGVAHELNNPLAVVVAQSTLLEELADSPSIKKRAERIHAAADRCGRIVKTFLAMARQQAPSRDTVNLSQIIEFAMAVMSYGLKTSGVEVEMRLSSEELLVDVDSDQLSQVVSNILVNAQQALATVDTPRRLVIETGRSGDGSVFIRIADNGPGVSAELHERIFEAYFTTKPVGAGTGIGLAVSRNIVRAHGGSLSLEETGQGGASFLLELPAAGLAMRERERLAPRGSFDGFSILVVDDEPDVGGTLADILDSMGAETALVLTRSDAMMQLRNGRFDLVMSDLRMPDGGGTALHRELSEGGNPLAASMVFVTGDTVAGPGFITSTLGEPSPLVLEKPFGRDDVASIVQAALERGGKLPAA
jgi:PAS domain S-box-containing protein